MASRSFGESEATPRARAWLPASPLVCGNYLCLLLCVDGHARGGEMERINIAEKFARFSEQWQPKIVAELNGQEVKLVKVQGTFPWHHHHDLTPMFLACPTRFPVDFPHRI